MKIKLQILFLMFTGLSFAQQSVYSRSDINSTNWWDGAEPWWYGTWSNGQQRPDLPESGGVYTRNDVNIDHNNHLNMSVNGAFFQLNKLSIGATSTDARVFTSVSGGGISFTDGFYNSSVGSQTFNVQIGVDGSTVNFSNLSTGLVSFNDAFYLNANTANFGGTGNLVINGIAQGTGGISMVGSGNLSLTGANTYTGTTAVSAGVLELNRTGGSTIPTTNSATVSSGGKLHIRTDQELATLTLDGGLLEVDSGITLTVTNLQNTGASSILGTGNVIIKNSLTITSGTLTTNGNLKLKGDASGTAQIASGAGTISGDILVERYIPSGKRAFRLLTPGVTTANFISNNWQEATHITGSTTGANGFDATATGNSSLYTYNNQVSTGSGWEAIPNTDATNLDAAKGYRLLIRGDRTPSLITTASQDNMNTAITLVAKGSPMTGTVTFDSASSVGINNTTNTTTADFSLIGNPYWSVVDWNEVSKSGLDATYYAWDPNMGSSSQRGRYVAYNGITNMNSVDGLGTSAVNELIQPGQAFFVKNTISGTAGSLTFDESDKATTETAVFKTANSNVSSLSAKLYLPADLALGEAPVDGAVALFSDVFSDAISQEDALKLEAPGENIAWNRNSTLLCIDGALPLQDNDELLLVTKRVKENESYILRLDPIDFDTTLSAFLVDNYLQTQNSIDLSGLVDYPFSTNSDVLSRDENRFKVIFSSALHNNSELSDLQFTVYPNPVIGDSFTLVLPKNIDNAKVELYTTLGQLVFKQELNSVQQKNKIHLEGVVNTGIYLLTVKANGLNASKLITIK